MKRGRSILRGVEKDTRKMRRKEKYEKSPRVQENCDQKTGNNSQKKSEI